MYPEPRLLSSQEFPPLLTEIADPPEALWVRGKLPSTERTWITVVGSRKHTSYGREAASAIIAGLRGQPVVIVSGLALGIDAIAHDAALKAGLPTIAVPGSGLSDAVLYPRTNVALAKRILADGGALLSEYAPDFHATQWSFPRRNRIMAGIAHATLVIEADERSGTLITARLAADYDREVLAVPGSIFSSTSDGPNALIATGAALVRTSDDVLHALRLEPIAAASDSLFDEHDLEMFTDTERKIIEALREPMRTDEISEALALDAREANIVLMRLAIRGTIIESGGAWRRGS